MELKPLRYHCEKKYRKIVLNLPVFDKILKHKDANAHIVANTYLHVLNTAYPDFLANYNISKLKKIMFIIRSKLISFVRVLQSIFNGEGYYVHKKRNKVDVLFISHLTNKNQIFSGKDPYFGDLSQQLKSSGVISGVVLINHLKMSKRQILSGFDSCTQPYFVLSHNMGLADEIKMHFAHNKSKKLLVSILKKLGVSGCLKRDILRNYFSASTFGTLRIAKQISAIVKETGARYIVTTYEGHAWERLTYYYSRQVNPKIKCFGYQHSAVFEHQHAISRPLKSQYNPDVILTSGKVSFNVFNEKDVGSKIILLGSPKYLSLGDGFVTNKDCCLVIPQGEITECLLLFGFSLKYARQHPYQNFIWRLHPLLTFDKLKRHTRIFEGLPSNIVLSCDSLEGDIRKSDRVLYRGSTAVIDAIRLGLKPIYYRHSSNELSIDPIYQIDSERDIVCNAEELKLSLNRGMTQENMLHLQDFVKDFYTPVNYQALLGELKLLK